jgi:DNA-binding transcriptional regulator GbsR (MarR family)
MATFSIYQIKNNFRVHSLFKGLQNACQHKFSGALKKKVKIIHDVFLWEMDSISMIDKGKITKYFEIPKRLLSNPYGEMEV